MRRRLLLVLAGLAAAAAWPARTLQVTGPAGLPSYLSVALVDASGRAVLNGGYPVVEGGGSGSPRRLPAAGASWR